MSEIVKHTNGHSVSPGPASADPAREVPFQALVDAGDTLQVWCDASMTIRWMSSAAECALEEAGSELSPAEMNGEPLEALVSMPPTKRKALRASPHSAIEFSSEVAGKQAKVTVTPAGR